MSRLSKKVAIEKQEREYTISTRIPASLHKAWRIKLLEEDITAHAFLREQVEKFVGAEGKPAKTTKVTKEKTEAPIPAPEAAPAMKETEVIAAEKPAAEKAIPEKAEDTPPPPPSSPVKEEKQEEVKTPVKAKAKPAVEKPLKAAAAAKLEGKKVATPSKKSMPLSAEATERVAHNIAETALAAKKGA